MQLSDCTGLNAVGAAAVLACFAGDHFGECDVLFSATILFSVLAISECELYSLAKEDLHELTLNYGAFGLELRTIALDRMAEYEHILGRRVAPSGFLSYLSGDGNTAARPTDAVYDAGVAVKTERTCDCRGVFACAWCCACSRGCVLRRHQVLSALSSVCFAPSWVCSTR